MGTPGDLTSALKSTIATTDQLKEWVSADQERKSHALGVLSGSIRKVQALAEEQMPESYGTDNTYFSAAIEMQSGYLLMQAQNALETGEIIALQDAERYFNSEHSASKGQGIELPYEKDLLGDDAKITHKMGEDALLKYFQDRTCRTLDNMVSETKKVLSDALEQIKNTFGPLKGQLEQIFESFSDLFVSFSSLAGGAIVSAFKKIIDGLNKMAALLKIEGLETMIASLKEFVQGLDAERMIGNVFGCESTKEYVGKLKVSKTVNKDALKHANKSMTDLSRQFVFNLQQMSRLLAIVGLVGGGLWLSKVAPQYVGPALPLAFLVIALVTLAIGRNFARRKMHAIIPGFTEA